MTKPWETDSCEAVQSYYSCYTIPKAAALWCKVPPDQVAHILEQAQEVARNIYRHPEVTCLEPRCRAIHDAIDNDKLACGRDGRGRSLESQDHVAPDRRTVTRHDLKEWIAREFPGDKPPFLFDDIERAAHSAITSQAYKALEAERDALKARIDKATEAYRALREQKEALESERDSLKNIVDSMAVQQKQGVPPESSLADTPYWKRLHEMAQKALNEFPEWRSGQRKVQKSANLVDWLRSAIGADNREAEILKKVLSDYFQELR
jgi:hypothetical protein